MCTRVGAGHVVTAHANACYGFAVVHGRRSGGSSGGHGCSSASLALTIRPPACQIRAFFKLSKNVLTENILIAKINIMYSNKVLLNSTAFFDFTFEKEPKKKEGSVWALFRCVHV